MQMTEGQGAARGQAQGEEGIAASLGALSLGRSSPEEAAAVPMTTTETPSSSSPPLVAMEGVFAALEEAISWPSRHGAAAAALGLRWPAGLLLHGPPGTGKSAAVAAAAAAAGAPLVVVSAGSVFGSALGESEARLRAAFARVESAAARARRKWERRRRRTEEAAAAREREEAAAAAAAGSAAAAAAAAGSAAAAAADSPPPPPRLCCGRAVLLLDDVDVLAPARSAAGAHEARVVAQLLTLLDGAGSGGGAGGGASGSSKSSSNGNGRLGGGETSPSFPPVVVIATTSKPGALDPALRRAGRLDREVSTSLPDARQREEILRRSAAAGLPLAPDVDLARIAAEARGYSGADLVALAREAARGAMAEAMKEEKEEDETEGGEGGTTARHRRQVVTAADFADALALVGASVSRGAVGITCPSSSSSSHPSITWDDVGGLEEAKSALRRAVELPLRRPRACSRLGLPPPRGVLLFGPPGCSKTTLASALATAAGASLHVLSAASLFSAYVGEGEAALRAAFASARAAAPAIVFLDEADAVGGGDRGGFGGGGGGGGNGADSSSARMLAALLAEVDGLESGGGDEDDEEAEEEQGGEQESKGKATTGGVLLLAATNRPWALDPALLRPGRLDCHVLVPPPDRKGRGDALRVHCRRIPLDADVDLSELGAQAPEGATGAELAAVAREAALAAAREGCDRVSRRHFERALEAAAGSIGVSRRDMERYEAWARGEI